MNGPVLPRKKKAPKRFDNNTETYYHSPDVKSYFRQRYYEALDQATNGIRNRFDQSDYKQYKSIQETFFKAFSGKDYSSEMNTLVETYSDICKTDLEAQLNIISNMPRQMATEKIPTDSKELVEFLQRNAQLLRSSPQVHYLAKLLLLMPATNAVSERSFSAMKRVKTYLRSTMTDNRLNHTMTLHIHKEETDTLDLVSIANEFCEMTETRKRIFGTFKTAV